LLAEGFLDKPFPVKLGSSDSWVQAVMAANFDGNTALASDGAFDLDGDGKNDVQGSPCVIEAVIPGVTEADARILSDRLDGASLSIASGAAANTADLKGRVKYAPSGGTANVYIYLTHH